MDKQVEMIIIVFVGATGLLALYMNQMLLATAVVSGLIGFLSHGMITETPAEPTQVEGEGQ
jgi:hypothetical protein